MPAARPIISADDLFGDDGINISLIRRLSQDK